MLLAIDIGNSSTKFGIFDGESLLHKFSIQTKRDYTSGELLFDRLKVHEKDFIQIDIDTCVVASVVPELNGAISQVCGELFKISPRFVDASWDFGFAIDYDPPSAAGADRLVNCFAAASKYGTPVVACSFGTATTIDVVSDENAYVGGIIAPGIATSAKALQLATSKLPDVSITKPDAVIGKTTIASIQSGIVNGHVAMVEGLINRIGNMGKVVATGGFARMIASQTKAIDLVDENLTLEGLRLLALRDGVVRLASTH